MNIGVLGAGTWGMALARMLANSGHDVTVWSALKQEVEEYSTTRRHRNLPGMVIPESIGFVTDIKEAIEGKKLILFAVPSIFVRSTAKAASPYITSDMVLVDVAKGIEKDTLYRMSEIIEQEITTGNEVVALSGPTHAEEVALDMPTTIVSACKNEANAALVQDVFMNENMRVYTNNDIVGVELCGALKNVIALASGISTGLGNGDNAKAAIITRGLAEITRLGIAMGCNPQTYAGLAGVGDLIVTATSMHSRNNKCGMLMGQGVKPEEAIKQVGMVVEGINALPAAMELSAKYNVELPICAAVNDIVHNNASPLDTLNKLMGRNKKKETY